MCDQLFTQLHALLTLQAGTFIESLFSVFVTEGKRNLQLSHVLFLWRNLQVFSCFKDCLCLDVCVQPWVVKLICFSSLHWLALAPGQMQHIESLSSICTSDCSDLDGVNRRDKHKTASCTHFLVCFLRVCSDKYCSSFPEHSRCTHTVTVCGYITKDPAMLS